MVRLGQHQQPPREEAADLLEALLSDRKIARATHNIWAYRAGSVADNDDDGETAAGRLLAELLAMTGAVNVLCVVTRWYGGIHLGPDRFRHINNVARTLLVAEGFVGSSPGPKTDAKPSASPEASSVGTKKTRKKMKSPMQTKRDSKMGHLKEWRMTNYFT